MSDLREDIAERRRICLECAHCTSEKLRDAACGISGKRVWILTHGEGNCPIGKHPAAPVIIPAQPPASSIIWQPQKSFAERCPSDPKKPGSVVKVVLSQFGFTPEGNCGCAAFCEQMNAWGWFGCFITHRREVVEWFIAKAAEQGIRMDHSSMTKLLRQAVRQLRKGKS